MSCTKAMSGCKRSCLHRLFVNDYRAARLAAEMARDETVGAYGYGSEEWQEHPPLITFKDWLQQMRSGE